MLSWTFGAELEISLKNESIDAVLHYDVLLKES